MSCGRFKNTILATLSGDDLALVGTHLEPVDLPLRRQLARTNRPIDRVYFLESGIASVTTSVPHGPPIEVGIIGREGFVNTPVLMDTVRSPNETYMQVPGAGHAIERGALLAAMESSPTLFRGLLRFVQAFMVQTASTALANARASVSQRLARWLLMAHDRLDGDRIPLTHEFLATMLAVRRPGVTVALGDLERQGLVAGERGSLTLLDRAGLEAVADGYYGQAEAEMRRLFK